MFTTSGAIKNPFDQQAIQHAELYYEEIRHRTSDVHIISQRLKIPEQDIQSVKNYLFIEEHHIAGTTKRFDPDFFIAQSWQRLSDEHMNIESHDVTLIRHELLEIQLIKQGMSQTQAHIIASETYNYKREAEQYICKG